MGIPKPPRGKLPLSIIITIICAFAFTALFFTQQISFFSSSSIFRFKPCGKRHATKKSAKGNNETEFKYVADDRFEFDPEECSLNNGKWVFNRTIKPFYTDRTCPYLDRQVSCVKNGKRDLDYQHWEWEPDDCILPRFDPKNALEKLRGKRMMFVGDSLQRGQWESFVCIVESVIPQGEKSMKRGRVHNVFKAKIHSSSEMTINGTLPSELSKHVNKIISGQQRILVRIAKTIEEYNVSIEFYWAPFLVESNSDVHIIADPRKRILKIDSVAKHAKHWIGVDIFVFNTYVWWMSGLKIKSLWGSFANGEEGYHELDAAVSYTLGLKTWANWVDSNVNPNKTKVFFTTMSPTHQRSADWGNEKGIKCFNETKPITKKRHWGTGSDKRIMRAVADVVGRMKTPVTLINVTQLSEYRIDAHSSIYTESGGRLLTDEEKEDPLHYADCIHWCLPGVPDTWNRILYAHLLFL